MRNKQKLIPGVPGQQSRVSNGYKGKYISGIDVFSFVELTTKSLNSTIADVSVVCSYNTFTYFYIC